MMRLVFCDLRDHVATWAGALALAVACGFIGGWAVSLEATGNVASMRYLGIPLLVFSLVAAVAVLASAANLTVDAQRRTYALWQLANVAPRAVSLVVLAQLAAVAVLGAVCGTVMGAACFGPLFEAILGANGRFGQMAPRVDMAAMPAIWLAVAGVFLVGGLKGARSAGRTPPLAALRNERPRRAKMTWLRVLLFVGLAGGFCWMAFTLMGMESDAVMDWSLYVPLLAVALLVPVAPLVFSALLTAWTALVPRGCSCAWYLARRTARFGLVASTSTETPIMVGFGLVAGIFSVIELWAGLAAREGAAFTGLELVGALLLLGGPILLAAVGAAVSVLMTARTRTRDVALLVASGARPGTLLAAAVCEALIHTVTATLAGMAAVVVSNAVVAVAVGMPPLADLAFGEGLGVSLAGFALVLVATLAPTCAALRREPALVLAAGE